MAKTVTIRLSDEEYNTILVTAKNEHRPISNFITYAVMKKIRESRFVNSTEMEQIRTDTGLVKSLQAGHNDVKKRRGGFVE